MGDLTIVYLGDCGGAAHHYTFSVRKNGVEVHRETWERDKVIDEIKSYASKTNTRSHFLSLLSAFAIEWRETNPAGTLAQFRTAVEAKVFKT